MCVRRGHPIRCLLSLILAVLLCGCAGATSEQHGHGDDRQASLAAPTGLPVDGTFHTSCTDDGADAGGVDSTGVIMVGQGDQLVVAFSFANALPDRGTLSMAVEARSRDGNAVLYLGIQLRDGSAPEAYVATAADGDPVRLDDAVHVADRGVHAAFPLSSLESLGSAWSWHSIVRGSESGDDFCPGGADVTLSTVGSISVG